jgi:cell division protein ZapA
MAEKSVQSISVEIAGREYPLKVEKHEVEIVESIAKDLNKKIREFQRTYSGKDIQDCISMTLLTYVFELEKIKRNGDVDGFEEHFEKVDNLLSDLLES